MRAVEEALFKCRQKKSEGVRALDLARNEGVRKWLQSIEDSVSSLSLQSCFFSCPLPAMPMCVRRMLLDVDMQNRPSCIGILNSVRFYQINRMYLSIYMLYTEHAQLI